LTDVGKAVVVVVGIDYSTQTERALRAAFEHARLHAAVVLHVTHVSPPAANGEAAFLQADPLSLTELKDELFACVSSFQRNLPSPVPPSVRVFSHVLVDTPAQGLTSLAAELAADLIVVGTHGRTGLTRLLLGSVAEGVVKHAPCAVLVVPPIRNLQGPKIARPCPLCVEERRASAGRELWCQQHRQRQGRVHTDHQSDRIGAELNRRVLIRP
jgi:nucleotide-binding universal stress UspA family protein